MACSDSLSQKNLRCISKTPVGPQDGLNKTCIPNIAVSVSPNRLLALNKEKQGQVTPGAVLADDANLRQQTLDTYFGMSSPG